MTNTAGKQLGTKALFQQQQQSLNRQAKPGPVIIADGLRTPENIGGLMRLADAMGSRRVVLVDDMRIDISGKKISRIARETEKSIEIDCVSKNEFLHNCSGLQPMIALELTTCAESLLNVKLPEQCSLVIGSERHGISEEILDKCQRAVFIPMYGINGSMNVTHALAIALYEWRKQHAG